MKQQILSMAFDLFSQYGIKRVSMDDIARNMGISKRTLYSIFSDKETLLLEGIRYTNNQMALLLRELMKGDYTILDIVLLFHEEIMKNPRWYSPQYYEDLKKYPIAFREKEESKVQFADRCMEMLNRGIKEGVIREGINLEILTILAREQFKMTHPPKSFSHHSNKEVYNTVLITFLRGISTEKGNAILDRWSNKKEFSKNI